MKLPTIITEDWPRKLTALFFAVLIWFSVNSQLQDHVVLQDVPVVLDYDPTAVVPERDVFTVDVKVRGTQTALRTLQTSDINISAAIGPVARDISFYSVSLSTDQASSPFGTRVVEIIPDRLSVGIDRIIRKQDVPVRPRFRGSLAKGYSKARARLFPKTVNVRGPSGIVRDVQEVVTEPIILDESLQSSFETDVRLAPIPRVSIGTETVHVSVEITRNSIQKPLANLPVHILIPPASGLRPVPPLPTVSVTLHGPHMVLDELDPSAVKPFLDLGGITNPGRYRFPVQVWVEANASVTSETVFPAIVEVQLARPKPELTPRQVNAEDAEDSEAADPTQPLEEPDPSQQTAPGADDKWRSLPAPTPAPENTPPPTSEPTTEPRAPSNVTE